MKKKGGDRTMVVNQKLSRKRNTTEALAFSAAIFCIQVLTFPILLIPALIINLRRSGVYLTNLGSKIDPTLKALYVKLMS